MFLTILNVFVFSYLNFFAFTISVLFARSFVFFAGGRVPTADLYRSF